MNKRGNISNLLDRLAVAEGEFLKTRFLAPVVGDGEVIVRIAGAVCRMKTSPHGWRGWGVFRPVSFVKARLECAATMAQRREYLALFPAVRLILAEANAPAWLAAPASFGDERFAIDGFTAVYGVEDAETFDTVITRFDGERFWFDQVDPQADPSHGVYLRESIVQMRDPRKIDRPGLSPAQRDVYARVHAETIRRKLEAQRATGEYRLKSAIEHAGAKLVGFSELGDVYRVNFVVDNVRHTSVVNKKSLAIRSAGVCLSGEDGKFDLASLVSVLRKGQQRGIYHGLEV